MTAGLSNKPKIVIAPKNAQDLLASLGLNFSDQEKDQVRRNLPHNHEDKAIICPLLQEVRNHMQKAFGIGLNVTAQTKRLILGISDWMSQQNNSAADLASIIKEKCIGTFVQYQTPNKAEEHVTERLKSLTS